LVALALGLPLQLRGWDRVGAGRAYSGVGMIVAGCGVMLAATLNIALHGMLLMWLWGLLGR